MLQNRLIGFLLVYIRNGNTLSSSSRPFSGRRRRGWRFGFDDLEAVGYLRDSAGEGVAPAEPRFTLISFSGLSSASRNRAQKSVAPPPLTIAARTTFAPLLRVSRLETPSSMTVWRSP